MALRDTCVSPNMSYVELTLITLMSVSDLFDVTLKQKNRANVLMWRLDLEEFFLRKPG